MGMRELERAIMAELQIVAMNKKLRLKHLMEWSTSKLEAGDGEAYYFLPELKIHCAVKYPLPETPERKAG